METVDISPPRVDISPIWLIFLFPCPPIPSPIPFPFFHRLAVPNNLSVVCLLLNMEDTTREEKNDGDDWMDREQCGTSRLTDVLPLTALVHAMTSCGLDLEMVHIRPLSIVQYMRCSLQDDVRVSGVSPPSSRPRRACSTRLCARVCGVSDVYRDIHPIVYHHCIYHVGFPVGRASLPSGPIHDCNACRVFQVNKYDWDSGVNG